MTRLTNMLLLLCLSMYLMCQKDEALIAKIDRQLAQNQTTISKVLGNPELMQLHSLTPFREVIKKHAKAEKINIVTADEPGKRITVKGEVTGADGKPLKDLLVYVYQTSDKGWYADTAAHVLAMGGDVRHARLFGYLKTDDHGRFEYETIQPKGYPKSDLPAHIHIAMWAGKQPVYGLPGELLFDDDPRLAPERRKTAERDGFIIAKDTGKAGSHLYEYHLTTSQYRQ